MQITLNISANNPAELQETIAGLAAILGGAVAPQPESVKPKRNNTGTNKPEKQADPEVTKPEETNTGSTETEKVPTVVELRAKAQEKGTTLDGKKAIKALLDKFESKSISDVPEEKRAAFLAELEAL